jgi:uncharacterized protein with PQ loop repeat
MKNNIFLIVALLALPLLVFAQGYNVWSLWGYIFHLIASITRLLWVLTTLAFLWGLVNFMRNADNERERANAKQMMKGSIIAFFIAVTFWGLVTFAIKAFNFTPDRGIDLPITTSN